MPAGHRVNAGLFAALVFVNSAWARPDRPTEITRDNFDALRQMIKPNKWEWKWTEIPWAPNLWEARREAAEQGKPLFVWSMDGEPLGQC
jgi:hypothetical protein